MIVRSTTGVEYEVVKPIGEGGVGRVFRAKRVRDGHDCALKVYDGIRHPDRTKIFFRIKKNIQKLMQDPICCSGTKQPCREFVGPLDADSLIELDTNKFGYIMELVDTRNEFITLTRFRTKADQRLFCRAARSIAELFRNVHFSGWCYKDINEKNIYINPQTAEVRIIDCDNISVQSVKVILGTPGFMAPEIYRTEAPDIQSDYFSTAVLFYRLMLELGVDARVVVGYGIRPCNTPTRGRSADDVKRVVDAFVGHDVGDVKSFILFDVVIPATKNLLSDIVTKGTIDERILKALQAKDKTQAALIEAVKADLKI